MRRCIFFNVMISDFDLKKAERRLLNSEDVEDSEYNISPFYLARKNSSLSFLRKQRTLRSLFLIILSSVMRK
ncbi:hypothetical protein XO10_04500 [Marinitoga sp. 1135]|nr:hypothetical protein LN42_05025 [Marinitoga sp. 1137]NUU95546.1 hypothetical protein [Marinitoga sp. 1135]